MSVQLHYKNTFSHVTRSRLTVQHVIQLSQPEITINELNQPIFNLSHQCPHHILLSGGNRDRHSLIILICKKSYPLRKPQSNLSKASQEEMANSLSLSENAAQNRLGLFRRTRFKVANSALHEFGGLIPYGSCTILRFKRLVRAPSVTLRLNSLRGHFYIRIGISCLSSPIWRRWFVGKTSGDVCRKGRN
jgi:hypothetical protein